MWISTLWALPLTLLLGFGVFLDLTRINKVRKKWLRDEGGNEGKKGDRVEACEDARRRSAR